MVRKVLHTGARRFKEEYEEVSAEGLPSDVDSDDSSDDDINADVSDTDEGE